MPVSRYQKDVMPHDRKRVVLTVLKHRQVDVLDQRVESLKRAIADDDLGFTPQDLLSSTDAQAIDVSWKSRTRHSWAGLRLLCLKLLQLLGGVGCRHTSLGMRRKGDVGNHGGVNGRRLSW